MGKGGENLQDLFLNQVKRERVPVIVYLTNGFQIRGKVVGFDSFTVVLLSDGRQMMIYKHAISTISPLKPLKETDLSTLKPQELKEEKESMVFPGFPLEEEG